MITLARCTTIHVLDVIQNAIKAIYNTDTYKFVSISWLRF